MDRRASLAMTKSGIFVISNAQEANTATAARAA